MPANGHSSLPSRVFITLVDQGPLRFPDKNSGIPQAGTAIFPSTLDEGEFVGEFGVFNCTRSLCP
jgi:hypothetical protein